MYFLKSRKNLLRLLGLLLVAALLFCMSSENFTAPAAETAGSVNWGLSFRESGNPPVGNKDREYLKEFNAYFLGDTSSKTIYLTFDCGYENGNMPAILSALEKHGAKAAFFVVGHFIKSEPELLKKMIDAGHIIGNHTYSHPDMSAIESREAFLKELSENEKAYKDVTGLEMPKFYRPPRGVFSEENLKNASTLGYKTFFWSLAYVDWNQNDQPNPEESIKLLKSRIHGGAVLLLHSTSSTNAAILDTLLTEYENMGYSFGSLTDF